MFISFQNPGCTRAKDIIFLSKQKNPYMYIHNVYLCVCVCVLYADKVLSVSKNKRVLPSVDDIDDSS